MKIYTIGFTQKTAETFFELIHTNNIQYLVDIRVHPSGQLAAFARQEDLPYLLDRLADHCAYIYLPDLAPTQEMMKEYRSGHDWPRYMSRFEKLMDERGIPDTLDRQFFESFNCCLLCSEAEAQHCHRRLVAERMASHWENVEIVHL